MYQINPKLQSLYMSFVILCLNCLLKGSICALIVALALVIIWLYNSGLLDWCGVNLTLNPPHPASTSYNSKSSLELQSFISLRTLESYTWRQA